MRKKENKKGNKVVLISRTGYTRDKVHILENLLTERIKLFCAVGKDCTLWEEIMDELCVGDGSHPVFVLTTSHPGESPEEVIEFAENFSVEDDLGVRVIEA